MLLFLVATVLSLIIGLPYLFLKLQGKNEFSELVDSRFTTVRRINWVNFIYKVISLFHTESQVATIDSLIIYPIKSCGVGMIVKEWKIGESGLLYDRQYVFATYKEDLKAWAPITLKEKPELLSITYECHDGNFVVRYGEGESFEIPMEVTESYLKENSSREIFTVKLWREYLSTYDISKVVPDDFFTKLGLPSDTKLLYTVNGHEVKLGSPKDVKDTINGSKFRFSKFLDYYPFLILSQSSLHNLNDILAKSKFKDFEVNESTFRPNFVLKGDLKPHDEDHWFRFRVHCSSDNKFHYFQNSSKCPRCIIPNLDCAGDLKLDKRSPVTKTLSKYRRVDLGSPYSASFGVYSIHLDKDYVIRSGDSIDVLQRKVSIFEDCFF